MKSNTVNSILLVLLVLVSAIGLFIPVTQPAQADAPPAAGTFSVEVLYDGSPVTGATVTLFKSSSSGPPYTYTPVGSHAAEGGSWTFTGLSDGYYVVQAVAEGYAQNFSGDNSHLIQATRRPVNSTAGYAETLNMVLGGPISGTVTSSSIGIDNISVIVKQASPGTESWIATTRDGGQYKIFLPYGNYDLSAPSGVITPSGPAGSADPQYQITTNTANISNASGDPGTDFVLSPVASGTISGHIYDRASGTPIANATVTFMTNTSPPVISTALTGIDGSYTISGLNGQYRVNAVAAGHARRWWVDTLSPPNATFITVNNNTGAARIDLKLETGGTISGTITSGVPLADISVMAEGINGNAGTGVSVSQAGSGDYTINGLPFGDYRVYAPSGKNIGAADSAYLKKYYDGTSEGTFDINDAATVIIAEGSSDYTGADLDLVQGGTVNIDFQSNYGYQSPGDAFDNGEVTGNEGWNSGFWGPSISLSSVSANLASSHDFDWQDSNQPVTGPDIDDLYHYQWSFNEVITGAGMRASVGLQNNPVPFTPGFSASRTADPIAFTAEGNQVLTVSITPQQALPNLNIGINAWEDDFVNATITSFSSPNGSPLTGKGISGDGRNLGINITSPGLSEYIYEITLHIEPKQGSAEYMPQVNVGWYETLQNGTVTGTEITPSLQTPMSGAGDWTWQASNTMIWNWNSGIHRNISFESYSGIGNISGNVKKLNGDPIEGASINVSGYDFPYGRPTVFTDNNGNYAVHGLPQGDYRVEAWAPGYERRWYDNSPWWDPCTPVTVGSTADFTLGPGGTISGTVRDGDTELAGINIGAGRQDGDGAGGAQTDQDGHYAITGLPLGTYNVSAPTQDGTPYIRQNINGIVLSTEHPDANQDFDLERGVPITGNISAAGGGTLTGATVGAAPWNADPPNDQWWANADEEGNYSLIVPPGSYRIHAWAENCVGQYYNGVFDWTAATSVSAGQTGVNFILDPAGSISGTIIDKDTREPIPNISVDCWRIDGAGGGGGKTDANGVFIITNLPFGHYNLAAPSGGRWGEGDDDYWQKVLDMDDDGSPDSVAVSGPDTVTGQDFELEKGLSITGTVTDAGGTVQGTDVSAAPWDADPPNDLWRTNTDENGDYRLIVPADGAYRLHAGDQNHTDQYYSGVYDWTLANEVDAGDENVDFILLTYAEWNNLNHVGVAFSTNYNNNINNRDSFDNHPLMTYKSWDSNIYNNDDGSDDSVENVISTLGSTIYGNSWSAWPEEHSYSDNPQPSTWTFTVPVAENNGAKVDVWLTDQEEYSPGVDIQREIAPRTITGLAGEQITRTLTVTVTPEPDELSQVDINIFAPVNSFFSPSIDSNPANTYYTLSGEGTVNYYHIWSDSFGSHLDMGVNKPESGRPVTVIVTLNMELLADCNNLTYMPDVTAGRSQNLGNGTLIDNLLERSVNELGLWTWEGSDSYVWHWNEGIYKRMTLNGYVTFPPAIDNVSPNTASAGQTLDVNLSGQNFFGATSLSFGDGITVNWFNSNDNDSISANITIDVGAVEGPRDVTVTALGGTSTLTDGFSVVQPAGVQSWKLDGDPNLPGTLIMEQSGTQTGSQDLGASDSLYWLSSHSAASEVTFPEDTWTVYLKFQNDEGWITKEALESTVHPRIGIWDPHEEPGSEFIQAQYYETAESCSWDPATGIYRVELLSGDLSEPVTVPEGKYLCLAVFNDVSPYQIITDGDSRLEPPVGSPNFPVPELAAGLLLALGLAGIGGFIIVKRKRA